MAVLFKPAARTKVKLKILILGPTNSGKTFGALHIADGLTPGSIGLIDSEHDRADYYAEVVKFVKASPESHHPKAYIAAIQAAVDAGLETLIIDSLSHCWLDVLARKDAFDKANPRSNQWTNWAIFGAEWDALIRYILEAPIHIICTGRSKMAYEQVEQGGRKTVVKLGLAPQLRENTEYEFAIAFSIEFNHRAQVSKDNTNLLSEEGRVWNLVDGSVPALLRQWMQTAREVERPTPETSMAIDDSLLLVPVGKQETARRRVAERRQRGLSEVEAQALLQSIRSLAPTTPASPTPDAEPTTPPAPTPPEPTTTAPQGDAATMTAARAALLTVKLNVGTVTLGSCDDATLVDLAGKARAKGRDSLVAAIELILEDRALARDAAQADEPAAEEAVGA